MTEIQVAGRALAWYGVAQGASGLLMLVSVPIWVRLIGGAEYADYAIIWAVAVAGTACSTGWLRQAMLRETGSRQGDLRSLPHWPIVMSAAAPAAACAGAGALVIDAEPGTIMTATAFGASFAIALIVSTVLQQRERPGLVAAAESGRAAGALIISLVLIEAASRSSLSVLAAAAVANTAVVFLLPSRASYASPPTSGRSVLATWWSYGWPMSLWLGLAPAVLYSDRILLAPHVGDATLGAYAAASDLLVRGFAVVSTPIAMVLHPAVMKAANTGHTEAALALSRRWAVRLAAGLALGVVVVALAGRPAAEFVLGGSAPSTGTLIALAAGACLWQLGLLLHKPLEIARQTVTMLVLLCASFAVALVLIAGLSAAAGPLGAATGMACGTGLYAGCTLLFARRLRLRSIS